MKPLEIQHHLEWFFCQTGRTFFDQNILAPNIFSFAVTLLAAFFFVDSYLGTSLCVALIEIAKMIGRESRMCLQGIGVINLSQQQSLFPTVTVKRGHSADVQFVTVELRRTIRLPGKLYPISSWSGTYLNLVTTSYNRRELGGMENWCRLRSERATLMYDKLYNRALCMQTLKFRCASASD